VMISVDVIRKEVGAVGTLVKESSPFKTSMGSKVGFQQVAKPKCF